MRKEVELYLIAVLLLGVVFLISFFPTSFTGHVVLEDYTNEVDCVNDGYVWENLTEETCTTITTCVNETIDCDPCLKYEDLNGTQGDCIEFSSCIDEVCEDEETCEDILIGGQCTGDICDTDHLDLCLDETSCIDTGEGYWYSNICNANEEPSCSNDLDLCLDETSCIDTGEGYWYDDICNFDECSSNEQCDSGYGCSGGECVVEEGEEESSESKEWTAPAPKEWVAPTLTYELSLDSIPPLTLNPSEAQQLSASANNAGTGPLTTCTLKPYGEGSEWISLVEDTLNINQGEKAIFLFSVTVPKDATSGSYELAVSVECFETSTSKQFTVNVVKKTFEFDLIDVGKIKNDEVRARYTLNDLSGEDQTIALAFVLTDNQGQIVSEVSESQNLSANDTDQFRTILPINETIEGNLSLGVTLNSKVYSSSVQEAVTLGSPPILGFAVFDAVGPTGSIIILVIVVAVLVAIVFIVRKLRKSPSLKLKK